MYHLTTTPESITEAWAIQKELAQKVIIQDLLPEPITYIAGVDISNNRFDPEKWIFGAIVVLSYPSLQIVEVATQATRQTFPYIPGLLGFREVPTLVQAYQQLTIRPDLIMVDGHGISHPRGLGVASHLGVVLNLPTIGVAKSILIGQPKAPLAPEPGHTTPLLWKGKTLALQLRTKYNCLPLTISAGHRITLDTALQWVNHCLRSYRLPEPTRQAHLMANAQRKKALSNRL